MPTGLDLKVERIRARVTAIDLAKAMGVSRQRISQIEGRAFVNVDLAARYRTALQVAESTNTAEPASDTAAPQQPTSAA